MTYRGHVRNGKITLDEPVSLPEGAEVSVDLRQNGAARLVRGRRTNRIRLNPDLASEIANLAVFHPDEG